MLPGQTVDQLTPVEAAGPNAPLHALTILHHPELRRVGERAILHTLAKRAVLLSRETPTFAPIDHAAGSPLAEDCVSRTPLLLEALDRGGVRLSLGDSRTKVLHRDRLVEQRLELTDAHVDEGVVLRLGGAVVLLLHKVTPSIATSRAFGLVGESDGIRRARRDIERLAGFDVPVLIRGETGTGKEIVARAIHAAGAREGAPFVAVNLGAVPSALAAAELFGSERGAFTGAGQQKPGYFEAARGGTLFLDEVGEAPPEVQVMLLRALETGEIQRVGASRPMVVHTRIVAATDADLEAKIQAGSFRAPLLHRLAVHEIRLPPLRSRRDDIARLLLAFLRAELDAHAASELLDRPPSGGRPWLSASLVARLAQLDWPGNVRQLRNTARQIALACAGSERAALTSASMRALGLTRTATSDAPGPRRRPAEITDDELAEAMRACRWDLAAAAMRLNISRPSLYARIAESPRFRTAVDLTPEEIARCHAEHRGNLDRMVDALEISEMALRRRLHELGLLIDGSSSKAPKARQR